MRDMKGETGISHETLGQSSRIHSVLLEIRVELVQIEDNVYGYFKDTD